MGRRWREDGETLSTTLGQEKAVRTGPTDPRAQKHQPAPHFPELRWETDKLPLEVRVPNASYDQLW